ncbi:MAG: DUF6531 domain-containing protein [Fluviicoccus sp.]|uniref:DUF6765 family protein n=1 Tax=Fluviicoccus sp. TaxID=2003552 RepID=UPI00272571A4|nr:DUF6765 family protein [Fluviicoccus sp.]MDO8329575.1 DUF6531 domain-containing protein [Fluviicoccus sp.]
MPRKTRARISPLLPAALVVALLPSLASAADIFPTNPPGNSSPVESGNTSSIFDSTTGGGLPTGGMCLASGSGNPTPGQCDSPPAAVASGQPSAAVGNPVNVMNGNKFQAETDLPALPGVLGLQWSRTYNSQSRSRGLFGVGWRHAYEVSLLESPHAIQIIQADGRRLMFPKDASGSCVSVRPQDGRLEKTAQGWKWVWVNGRELAFEPRATDTRYGRLISIRETRQPGQPLVSLRYGMDGELVSIRDPLGRSLEIHTGRYGAAKWPEVRVDSPTGRFLYRLDGDGKLLTVQRADGVQIGYYYEDWRQGGDRHNLTGRALWQPGQKQWQRQATWAYDEQDRAILSEHAGGVEKVSLRYDSRPHQPLPGSPAHGPEFETVLTNSLGRQTRYRWQPHGQEWRLLESRGAGCASCGEVNRRYRYDAAGQVVREESLSPDGNLLNWQDYRHDARGRVTSIARGAAGTATVVENFRYGRPDLPWTVTAVLRPSVLKGHEAETRFEHDAQGRLTAREDVGYSPLGERLERRRQFTYDAAGRLLSEDGPLANLPDGRGDISRYHYDAQGRLDRLEGVGGLRLAVKQRDRIGRLTVLDVRNGTRRETWRLDYDRQGHLRDLSREADGLSARHQQFHYDEQGRLLASTDVAGLQTRIAYDAAGRLQRLIRPDGQVLQLARDTENRLLSLQRLQGEGQAPFQQLSWQYRENAEGRSIRQQDSLGLISEQQALNDGRQLLSQDALGQENRTLVDGRGRWQASQLRALGVSLPPEWQRVEPGVTTRTGAGLQAVTGSDDWGRPVIQRLPGQGIRLYRYDAADNRIADAAENGEVHLYRYDFAGRRIAEGSQDDPEAVVTRYDGDLPVFRGGAKESRDWQYNAFGERVRESRRSTGPDGKSRKWKQVWSYDAAGRVQLESRDNLHLAYEYGKDGRISALYRSEGRLAALLAGWRDGLRWLSQPVADHLQYDAWGQLSLLRLTHGTEQYIQRDGRGRITRISTRYRTHSQPWLASILGFMLPDDWALAVENRLGLVKAVAGESRYRYDALNRVQERDEGGVQERYAYDAAGRLSRIETLGQMGWVETAAYDYDLSGNRRSERTQLLRTDYHYAADGVQWLGRQWHPSGESPGKSTEPSYLAQLASYDPLGRPWLWWQGVTNPVQGLSLAGLQTQQAPLWRLKLAGSQPVAWVNERGASPLRYGYDLQGLPAWQQLQTDERHYWRRYSDYGDALRLREEDVWRGARGGEQRLQRDYVYLGGLPVAVRVSGADDDGWGEVLANRQGAPVAVLDEGGAARWSAGYEAFGGLRETAGGEASGRLWAVSLRLPGQHEDPVTGFYQNGFRTYVPEAGRYLTPDPAGLRGGLNPFVYVGSDPLNAVDPWGLYQIDMHYYMTYFLGIVTGFSADQARTIALATQFVDENDYTVPLRDGGIPLISTVVDGIHNATDDRLAFYHFVNTKEGWINTLESGSYDPVRNKGESDENYKIRRLTANIESIPQIQNLEFNYRNVEGCNQKMQFFGEFLHAFEDTFAHRDAENDPFGLNKGTGHATGGENPDYTYNHVVGGLSVLGRGTWDVNEDRTLIAQEQVYRKMLDFRDSVGASGKVVPWEELRDYLVVFNSIHENAHGADGAEDLHTLQYKIRYLQGLLNGKGGNEHEMIFPGGSQSSREAVTLDLSEKLDDLDAERFEVILNVDGTVSAVNTKMPGWGYTSSNDPVKGTNFDLINKSGKAGRNGFSVSDGIRNRVDNLRGVRVSEFSGVIWDTGHKNIGNYKMYLDRGILKVTGSRPE